MTSFDKLLIATSFSRAAHSYATVADVQLAIGGWLLQSIQHQQEVSNALDIGCGSGALTAQLAERLPMASCTSATVS